MTTLNEKLLRLPQSDMPILVTITTTGQNANEHSIIKLRIQIQNVSGRWITVYVDTSRPHLKASIDMDHINRVDALELLAEARKSEAIDQCMLWDDICHWASKFTSPVLICDELTRAFLLELEKDYRKTTSIKNRSWPFTGWVSTTYCT